MSSELRANLDRVLIQAYALNKVLVCRQLIELFKPKLSAGELEYLEKDGPEIVRQDYLHDVYTQPGGCDEGRAARREARRLERLATDKLNNAGISPERQQLLRELLYAADEAYLDDFPPREIGHIYHHMTEGYRTGRFSRFRELAQLVGAPRSTQDFLGLLLKNSKEFATPPESVAA